MITNIIQSISNQFNIPHNNIRCIKNNNAFTISVYHPEGLIEYTDIPLRITDEPIDYMVYTQLEPYIRSRLKFDKLITYIINFEGN